MKTDAGVIGIIKHEDGAILLCVNVAEIGHPAPLVIKLTPHDWSQILAHPGRQSPCFVIREGAINPAPLPKAG